MSHAPMIQHRITETNKFLNDLYQRKNHDYGDSFARSYKEYGLTMAYIRIEDKLNRLKALSHAAAQVEDESILDTILDCANYAVMTAMELEYPRVGNTYAKKSDLHLRLLDVAANKIMHISSAAENYRSCGIDNFTIACVELGLQQAKTASKDEDVVTAFLFVAAYAVLGAVFHQDPSLLTHQEENV